MTETNIESTKGGYDPESGFAQGNPARAEIDLLLLGSQVSNGFEYTTPAVAGAFAGTISEHTATPEEIAGFIADDGVITGLELPQFANAVREAANSAIPGAERALMVNVNQSLAQVSSKFRLVDGAGATNGSSKQFDVMNIETGVLTKLPAISAIALWSAKSIENLTTALSDGKADSPEEKQDVVNAFKKAFDMLGVTGVDQLTKKINSQLTNIGSDIRIHTAVKIGLNQRLTNATSCSVQAINVATGERNEISSVYFRPGTFELDGIRQNRPSQWFDTRLK